MMMLLDCLSDGAGSCRNKDAFDELQARAEAAEAEAVTLRRNLASAEFLSEGKDEIFELFVRVRDEFDGTEYMQGKKDGLRLALALLGMPEMRAFNRGNGGARE